MNNSVIIGNVTLYCPGCGGLRCANPPYLAVQMGVGEGSTI